jgi:predicted transcriptional regulator
MHRCFSYRQTYEIAVALKSYEEPWDFILSHKQIIGPVSKQDISKHIEEIQRNPYGGGQASRRIVEVFLRGKCNEASQNCIQLKGVSYGI